MTTEPFEPNTHTDDIPAADPGRGAPEPAPGFGAEGQEAEGREPEREENPAPEPSGQPTEPPD